MSRAAGQTSLINVAHLLTHYCLLILPTAVLVMARPGGAFGSEYGPILALATAMFVLYGVFSLPQGWLARWIGRKNLMTAFFFGLGASLAGAAFAETPAGLAAALGAAGLFAAIYHPIGTAMLVEGAGSKPGRAIGLNGVFGNLGVALAPVVTASLAEHASWRLAFLLPGLFCAACGVAWLRVAAESGHAGGRSLEFPALPPALVRRAVLVLLLIAFSSGLIFNAFTLLLPKLLQERLASSPDLLAVVGAAAFAVTLCGALAQFTVGRLIDRMTLRRVFLPMAVVLAPALAILSAAQGWAVLPAGAVVAAVIFGQVTVNETMTARYIAPALRTKMYSVRFFIGFVGAAVSPWLVGALYDRTGSLAAATGLLAVTALITLAGALLFPHRPEELRPELWASPAHGAVAAK